MAQSKLIKQIISTDTARVAEYRIPAHSKGRRHRHSQVFEELFCLVGRLRIEIEGRDDALLKAGAKVLIPAGKAHCVNNDSDETARFLVVQGGGEFDLVTGA